ncbi:unnamed protein product [Schistosoma margrebowiei]|uniref:Rho-GAP domain-containing protein n=1 Tax=Schistosoma margrebowiei TaxID=48269 RepID=A0AA84ZZB4_9TREM|nr:unnamed protein product [Schistosoma margrebowiei]
MDHNQITNNVYNNNNTTLQLTIKDYSYRLRIGIKEDWKIKLFREYYPRRFQELCMVHLSFLIDIPWNFIDQKLISHSNNNNNNNSNGDNIIHPFNSITTNVCKDTKSTMMNSVNIGGSTKSRLKRLWNNWRINSHPVKSDYIPDELANNIITLIDCLDNDEACSVEGLFRKPGHTLRKRQIQEAVFQTSFDPKVFQLNKYNFHDFASALKSVLVRLPTPLFTEHLLPLFLQVAALKKFDQFHLKNNNDKSLITKDTNSSSLSSSSSSTINNDYLIHLIESKQIKAIRLLIQLLPNTNMKILKCLLHLLIRVKNLNSINRMTSTCLGTIFGPVLLSNDLLYETIKSLKNHKQPPIECQEKCLQLNSITSLLIEIGLDIFLLPYSLVQDICTNSPYMTIFKTDCQPLCNPMKQQSIQMKNNQLTSLLLSSSPQLHHLNQIQTNKDDVKKLNDSSPLRTAIRFATPTPTSIINFQVLDISPIQYDDIMEGSKTFKSKQQLKLENCIEQTPVLKWSRSVGEITTDYTIQYSADDENMNVTSVRSSKLLKMSTNMNHLSPSKYSNYANEDIGVDSVRRKFVKKRRFTELRLPSTINRTGGSRNCHRRYLFSPCPPIPLLPFKRVGGEKRNLNISPLSNIKGTLTNTVLPSW